MKGFGSFISAIKSGSIDNFNKCYKSEYLSREKSKNNNQLPIHIACEKGRSEIVKLLLDKDSCIDIPTRWDKMCPIHYACKNGHTDIVQILITNKCNIEARSWYDYRPIHLASEKGHSEIVRLLVNNKCEIDAVNKFNDCPIHLACRFGHLEVVKILIGHKCDISAINNSKQSPLEIASQLDYVEIIDIIKKYVEQTTDLYNSFGKICGFEFFINAIKIGSIEDFHKYYKSEYLEKPYGKSKQCAIHFACNYGHIEIVKILINNHCNIELENENGQRPIHFACENGHVDIVELLIDAECKLEIPNNNGQLPIHYACIKGSEEILEMLIKKNCDINATDDNGQNPLHYACQYGHVKISQILIDNNCNIEACDNDKMRPIHMTKNNENNDILNLLIDSEFEFRDFFDENITLQLDMNEKLNNEKHIEKNEIIETKDNCKICNIREINMYFNCGHTICDQCGRNLDACHICGESITTKTNIYL